MQAAPAALPGRHPLPHWISRYSSTAQGHFYGLFAHIYSYHNDFNFYFIKEASMFARFSLRYALLISEKSRNAVST